MSAELTYSQGAGSVADVFSVKLSMWHREGHVLTEAPSFEEALIIANLDYEVVKCPTRVIIPETEESDAEEIDSAKAFVTVRTDTSAELGMVGPDYVPVQNLEAFQIVKPLIDSGVASLETGGAVREGADAWLLVKWNLERFGPIVREVFADEVVPYGLISTNHTGRRGVLLQDTNIRPICANTLAFAEAGSDRAIKVRHTGDAVARLLDAAEGMWGGIIERYEVLALQYQALRETILTEAQFRNLVLEVIAPDPRKHPRWNPAARQAGAVLDRAEKKWGRLEYLWTEGAGHKGDRSAWEAYNGAVEALDHDVELWPLRSGVYRTASSMGGTLRRLKEETLSGLVLASGGEIGSRN